MEIKLGSATYCINPRRIVYVKHYILRVQGSSMDDISPEGFPESYREENPNLEKYTQFRRYIEIEMTDDVQLRFRTDDEAMYDVIKGKLEKIVGG